MVVNRRAAYSLTRCDAARRPAPCTVEWPGGGGGGRHAGQVTYCSEKWH